MVDTDRQCPVCSGACRVLGPVYHPQPAAVAGVPLDVGDTRFVLLRCVACGFTFKDPPIPQEKLLACYAKATWFHWEQRPDPIRRQFDRWQKLVEQHAPGRRILEIGCFNGAMLEYFGPSWERFGVEPGAEPARVAAERGVRILGPTIDAVPEGEAFDAIITVDVAEHIPDPLPFFRAAARRLRPGGALVVITGDTDSMPWRLEGSLNWYAAFLEHVSFYNDRSMREIGKRIGLASVAHLRTTHTLAPLAKKLEQTAKNWLFIVMHRLGGLGIAALRRLFVTRRAPSWQISRDHMVHIFRREPSPERTSG
jgi:SAM-dependent methyltransferase